MQVELPDTPVMCVVAEGGLSGIRRAWDRLEAPFETFAGRRFYGVRWGEEYRACVALKDGDNPETFGLERWSIPGGAYVSAKIDDWPRYTHEIPRRFSDLEAGADIDTSRPEIEYYRTERELILYLPITR